MNCCCSMEVLLNTRGNSVYTNFDHQTSTCRRHIPPPKHVSRVGFEPTPTNRSRP
ncbi:hypothetical protein BCR33DRAFT_306998 [Rhizoclosmatium globosum]|uniref:Uncharacterized protein n=1 Tax=Rhizoclosmatium globosum TaxID=329046 RepID=A0A1Y2C5G8_9FUNG|nr:hypothetical protein BCR33DRAFT_306998 [Rhizoclosmatium globosum]|eukprot:ORY42279.1 hypothetical protein BCR33DRAFT_306998 [Rhizoclosmatium globosum]